MSTQKHGFDALQIHSKTNSSCVHQSVKFVRSIKNIVLRHLKNMDRFKSQEQYYHGPHMQWPTQMVMHLRMTRQSKEFCYKLQYYSSRHFVTFTGSQYKEQIKRFDIAKLFWPMYWDITCIYVRIIV